MSYLDYEGLQVLREELGKAFSSIIVSEASGAIASFPDGSGGAVKSLVAQIEPAQDLHGYANPWPGGGGKNIAKLSAETVGSNQRSSVAYSDSGAQITATGTYGRFGWVIPVTAGTTYTLSFKGVASNTGTGYYNTVMIGKADGVWNTSSADYLANRDLSTTVQSYSYTFTATTNILFIGAYVTTSATSGTITLSDVQVEANASATSYAPYSNICPISGWAGAEGKRTGKNLIPNKKVKYGNHCWIGTDTDSAAYYLPLKAGTYTISASLLTGSAIWGRASNGGSNFRISSSTASTAPFGTFTVTTEDTYRFWIDNTSPENVVSFQLEVGSSATGYEPYTASTISVTFPDAAGTVYGGSLDVTNGVLTVEYVKHTFASTDAISQSGSNDVFYINTSYLPNLMKAGSWYSDSRTKCSMLPKVSGSTSFGVLFGSNSSFIYFYKVMETIPSVTDATSFKSWIAGCEIVYPLSTTVEYTLTPQEVTTLLGANNIWFDVGPTTVEYPADTKLYIDSKLDNAVAELQALILDS